jgi:murein DD-endopeptidase MepM/ murein hydrolase activator NlpD
VAAGIVITGSDAQTVTGDHEDLEGVTESASLDCADALWCAHQTLLRTAMQIRTQLLDEFLWGEVTVGPDGQIRTLTPPVDGPVSSRFGPRRHPILGYGRNHNGIDISAAAGTPVRSAAPGTVRRAGSRGDYGLAVEIDHGGGVTTLYAHLSQVDVVEGDVVARLAPIGQVGSTGLSTGPHLHFEVRRDGRPDDPLTHIDMGGVTGTS